MRRLGPALSVADVDAVFLSTAEWGKAVELQPLAFSLIETLLGVARANCIAVVGSYLESMVVVEPEDSSKQNPPATSPASAANTKAGDNTTSRLFINTLVVKSAQQLGMLDDHLGESIAKASIVRLGSASSCDLLCSFILSGTLASLPRRCIDAREAITALFRVLSTPMLISDEAAEDPDPSTVSMVDGIVALYRSLWLDDAAGRLVLVTLQAVYEAAVKYENAPSLVVLAPLVRGAPSGFITIAAHHIASSTDVSDDQAADFLLCIIDWLRWPGPTGLHVWIIAFLTELASNRRLGVLVQVTQHAAPRIVNMLGRQHTQKGGLIVLAHMLLSYQHSPSVFHKLIPAITELLPTLAALSSLQQDSLYEWPLNATSAVDALSALVCSMMELHQGYPDLYSPLLEQTAQYYHPSPDLLRRALDSSAWMKRLQGDSLGTPSGDDEGDILIFYA